jgi:hypothetical protein
MNDQAAAFPNISCRGLHVAGQQQLLTGMAGEGGRIQGYFGKPPG